MKFPSIIKLNFNFYAMYSNVLFLEFYWMLLTSNTIIKTRLRTQTFSSIWSRNDVTTLKSIKVRELNNLLITNVLLKSGTSSISSFTLRSLWANEHCIGISNSKKNNQWLFKRGGLQYLHYYLQSYWVLNFLIKQNLHLVVYYSSLLMKSNHYDTTKKNFSLGFWHKLLLTKIKWNFQLILF